MFRLVRLLAVLLLILASGCASLGPPRYAPEARFLEAQPETVACARFFQSLDLAVAEAGASDVEEARIAGLPHVRINRFLAGDWRPHPEGSSFEFWARRLLALDRHARRLEISNLPESYFAGLGGDEKHLGTRVEVCGERLLALDLSTPENRRQLFTRARVPDAYRGFYRVAGLYPITSIGFYLGVKGLQDEIERDFSVPREDIPLVGRLVRYQPASARSVPPREVAQILRRASNNPLEVPYPKAEDRDRLLAAFAPVLEVDVAQDDDRIGRPEFRSSAVARVNTQSPVVYTRLSHTRFESKSLLQLNYVFWFPSRPKNGALDILAGHLDGITWRVTLDHDGTPLIYDSMHNCGCYHLFIPTPKLRRSDAQRGFEEPLFSPQQLSANGSRVVLRIASRSHYLQRIYTELSTGALTEVYRLEDYARLRSLQETDGSRRSLFSESALVRGSERPERWLFWPMGVPSAGAMRQWGHHATAFVGRRHFDEPGLIARYFERADTK